MGDPQARRGIEGADFTAGAALSAPVARAVERVVAELRVGGPLLSVLAARGRAP